MEPQRIVDCVRTLAGGELVLYQRGGGFSIRVNGHELMSSHAHGSEEALATLACTGLGGGGAPRVLVAGLGMGYTLRAALDALPAKATVVVAEVHAAVVEWCRGPLALLAGRPLEDPRVEVELADAVDVVRLACERFDAVLLDIDNGPEALTLVTNSRLYSQRGLASLARCLRPRGVLAVWSADPDRAFARRLARSGFAVKVHQVAARGGGSGPQHTVFLARKKAPTARG